MLISEPTRSAQYYERPLITDLEENPTTLIEVLY
jgi:hypothetical protein